ncbi:hypothetical protein [Paenibacillus pabuli]|uniref:hypothetical protein n=1 Tax=Paenibacillus pabuli TaxID=1472 RepID=UPI003CEF8B4B
MDSNVIDLHRRLVNAMGQTYWGLSETEIDEMKLVAMNELAPYPKLSDSTNGKR